MSAAECLSGNFLDNYDLPNYLLQWNEPAVQNSPKKIRALIG